MFKLRSFACQFYIDVVQVFSKEKTVDEAVKEKVVTMLKGLDIDEELQPIEQTC